MTNYDNNNRGAVWKNDRKTTDKHPDFNGTINVDGKDYWVSAWRGDKENPKAPVLSFSVQEKDVPKQQPTPNLNEDFDDAPF